MKWRPAVGAAAEPSALRVDRLVALRVGERLGDVRRQRRLARGLALQAQPPAPLAQVLDQLDRAQSLPGPQLLRRTREPLPLPLSVQRLNEENLGLAAGRPLQPQPRRDDASVVDDDELAAELLGQVSEPAMTSIPALPLVDQQPRLVAPLGRVLRDQLLGQRVLELGSPHAPSGNAAELLGREHQARGRTPTRQGP